MNQSVITKQLYRIDRKGLKSCMNYFKIGLLLSLVSSGILMLNFLSSEMKTSYTITAFAITVVGIVLLLIGVFKKRGILDWKKHNKGV